MSLLAKIRAAWPATPYPGDHILSNCWCEECAFSVRDLRGKSWKQLTVGDLGSGSGELSADAFLYFLPGILSLSIQDPDGDHLAGEVNRWFVYSDSEYEPAGASERIARLVSRLSQRQREVLLEYLDWLAAEDWQAPMLIASAKRAIADGVVEPYSMEELLSWCREREAKSRTGA